MQARDRSTVKATLATSFCHFFWGLGFLSVFCSVICFFLSNYAISKLPLARETVFANLTTAVSFFAGVLILREPFTPLALLFIVLILAGIYGVQRASRKNDFEQ